MSKAVEMLASRRNTARRKGRKMIPEKLRSLSSILCFHYRRNNIKSDDYPEKG